jgi:hypothetical protein
VATTAMNIGLKHNKNLEKLSAIHKLGVDDCTLNLDRIKKYLN